MYRAVHDWCNIYGRRSALKLRGGPIASAEVVEAPRAPSGQVDKMPKASRGRGVGSPAD